MLSTMNPEDLPKLTITDSKGRVMGIFEAGKPIVMARFPDSTAKDIDVFIKFLRKIYQKLGTQEYIIEKDLSKAVEFLTFKSEEDEFCS